MNDNYKIRKMLNKDYESFKAGRAYFQTHKEDSHRFLDDVHSEIIDGEVPEWAAKFINDNKKTTGDVSEYHPSVIASMEKKAAAKKKAVKKAGGK